MFGFPGKVFCPGEIESLGRDVIDASKAGGEGAAWQELQPSRKAQYHQPEAARSLLCMLDRRSLPIKATVHPSKIFK